MSLTETRGGVARLVTLEAGAWGTRSVRWGESWEHGTAAYWLETTRRAMKDVERDRHRLTDSLLDEVALCMLGGFGMPYELALAAFSALHEKVLQHDVKPTETAIEEILLQPLMVGNSLRRYRFPHQRARRLSQALRYLQSTPEPSDPLEVRDWLLGAPGIGSKTASWIVRNRWPDCPVAILDVHVVRAGVRATVFPEHVSVVSAYHHLEALFVAWAEAGDLRPADLDATIWAEEATRARRSF